MLKKKTLAGLLAVTALAAASSAMAYPTYQGNVSYGPGSVVEWQGRVYQLCLNSCYSRGSLNTAGIPDANSVPFGPGQRWSYGNLWQDQGRVGSATVAQAPSAGTQTTAWQAGKGYSAGSSVTYQGIKYVAQLNIAAGSSSSQLTPNSTSRWKRA